MQYRCWKFWIASILFIISILLIAAAGFGPMAYKLATRHFFYQGYNAGLDDGLYECFDHSHYHYDYHPGPDGDCEADGWEELKKRLRQQHMDSNTSPLSF